MKVHLLPVDLGSLEYICLHLREQDRREIYNIRDYDNPMMLAWETFAMTNAPRARSTVAWADGKPVAFIALVSPWPMVWEAVAYGTDDWRKVAIDLMRWGRNTVRDILDSGEGHRLQAQSHEDHVDAHKFLRALGASEEYPPMTLYGKSGATYRRFVWLKGEHDHVLQFKTAETQRTAAAANGAGCRA